MVVPLLTVTVQNCPWATETLMSGLLDVAVNVWGSVVPLPSRGCWYPSRAGTVTFAIVASEAANNCRLSRTSTRGWHLVCFEPGRDPAPCRSERELTFKIRSNIPVSSPEAPAELMRARNALARILYVFSIGRSGQFA